MTWECKVWGYEHEGPEPCDPCPVCGAPGSFFEQEQIAIEDVAEPAAESALAYNGPALVEILCDPELI